MKSEDRREVMFAGFGGQGIVTAGFITGQAAVVYDGKEAILSQVYGPEARGSACFSGVVVSDGEISYPYLLRPQIMVIMSQEAYEKFLPQLQPGGVLIVDNTIVKPDKLAQQYRLYKVPATEIAEKLGARVVANVVMLGFLGVVWDAVSVEALQEAVKARVPQKYIDLNIKAFQTGVELAEEALKRKIKK